MTSSLSDAPEEMISCLLNSLNEIQETIRAYDTKAEILALIITLALGLLSYSSGNIFQYDYIQISIGVGSILMGILAIMLSIFVLFPFKDPWKDIDVEDCNPKKSYYIDTSLITKPMKLSDMITRLEETNWKFEISFEILKTSLIRDRKYFWFSWSVRICFISLLLSGLFWMRMLSHV